MFDLLVSLGKLITDFHGASPAGAPSNNDDTDMTLDDDIGVAIEFDEDDDDNDKDTNFYQVSESSV
jgi:pre-mRNA-splicing helicase BRR2